MFFIVLMLATGAIVQDETQHVLLRQDKGEAFYQSLLTFFVLFSFMIPMSLCMAFENGSKHNGTKFPAC